MFSQLTKRLQDGLEAVENSVAAVASSGSTAGQSAVPGSLSGSTERPSTPSTLDQNADGDLWTRASSSTSFLPEGLSSIRRSLTLQRASSPDPVSRAKSSFISPATRNLVGRELTPVTKRGGSLDERLRASLVGTTTPPSSITTPAKVTAHSAAVSEELEKSLTPLNPRSPVLPPVKVGERAIPANTLLTDPVNVPLPVSPTSPSFQFSQFPTSPPLVPVPVAADDDPLSLSLNSFETPRSSRVHAKNTSAVSFVSSSSTGLSIPHSLSLPLALASESPTEALADHSESNVNDVSVFPAATSPKAASPLEHASTSAITLSSPPMGSAGVQEPQRADEEKSNSDPLAVERLKLVEQRFSDMSRTFKRLQSERTTLDTIFREHTPLQGLENSEAVQQFLAGVSAAATKASEEIKQLTAQLRLQEERMQEVRDIHHLESMSRSQQIDQLQAERVETEALLAVAQEGSTASAAELVRVQEDLQRVKKSAKEEEEKRVKAISLLKTVRAKGVKTEKELEELGRERDGLLAELQKERDVVKTKEEDIESAKKDALREMDKLRAQGEADLNGLRIRLEREAAGKHSTYEAETANLKSAHAIEIALRESRVTQLESSLKSVTEERDQLFDQLQIRQAEVESSHSHQESLENQLSELRHQLRESNDRNYALSEDLADYQRRAMDLSRLSPFGHPNDSAAALQAVLDAERRHEAKLVDLRARMSALEKERTEAEEEWSRNLSLRSKEIDRLREELAARDGQQSVQLDMSTKADEERGRLESEIRAMRDENQVLSREIALLTTTLDQAKDTESMARIEQGQVSQKLASLESQLEEFRTREGQLRSVIKTLRDELKKVQNSAAQLERQRNPGIGYWAHSNSSRSNISSSSPDNPTLRPSTPAQLAPPTPAANGTTNTNDEEINLEYLRNLILQFLEHKEMRADLVRVMSVILRFTPAETRRLVSKV